jgi:hydroxyacylglutathione hydrolase
MNADMNGTLTRIRDDLWQTRTDSPFPGLTTRSYLWRGPSGNMLFYSPATDVDFDAIAELGGVAAQYLSHLDEAGPNLAQIATRFGSRLHAPAAELAEIGRHAHVDVPIGDRRHIDGNGVDVIPTPGHSPGSTCYLVPGADGEDYLFTGDTMFPTGRGTWSTYLVPGRGDVAEMTASLATLRSVSPGLVISSAFGGDTAIERVENGRWIRCLDEALASVGS